METNSRKIIKKLETDGFKLVKVVGSHHKFRKGARIVTVPHPKKRPADRDGAFHLQASWLALKGE